MPHLMCHEQEPIQPALPILAKCIRVVLRGHMDDVPDRHGAAAIRCRIPRRAQPVVPPVPDTYPGQYSFLAASCRAEQKDAPRIQPMLVHIAKFVRLHPSGWQTARNGTAFDGPALRTGWVI